MSVSTNTKIKNLFDDFIKKEHTQEFIKKIRYELGIPEGGIKLTQEHINEYKNDLLPDLWTPKIKYTPSQEVKKILKKGGSMPITIIQYCGGFVKKYGLDNRYFVENFRMYLYFNEKIELDDYYLKGETDFIHIEYLPDLLKEYEYQHEDKDTMSLYTDLNYQAKKYPVMILMNPNISQNEFKKNISYIWKDIIKHKDGKNIFNIRSRKNQRRDNFIYNNRKLSLAKMRRKLADELMEFLDDGHISKIRDLEIKKRNTKLNGPS